MHYFEIIKTVLDASLAKVCANRGVQLQQGHTLLAQHLKTMSDAWFSGEAPNIAYGDPFCRLAYLYCHVAANAAICELAIRESGPLLDFITAKAASEEELRVCAFGGGPGTELLALAKHLNNNPIGQAPLQLRFTILDRVNEWAESWAAIERAIDATMKAQHPKVMDRPFFTKSAFNTFDMTDVTRYHNLDEYLCHDLYVMNYVVSELMDRTTQFGALVKLMATAAPRGAFFLVIDRQQEAIMNLSRELLGDAQLNVVIESGEAGNMDGDEQVDMLEPFVSEIGRRPKVSWGRRGTTNKGIFWIVAQKS